MARVASGYRAVAVISESARSSPAHLPFAVSHGQCHRALEVGERHRRSLAQKQPQWPWLQLAKLTCHTERAWSKGTVAGSSDLGERSGWVEMTVVGRIRDLEKEVWVTLDEDVDAFEVADSKATL